jgi:osmoprotectant transport system permease protein
LTALDEIPAAVLDAGRGMGMSSFQLGTRVVLPLAWPAILAGIRVATVQTVGNTVVAALIGAGGLGTFIFQGLGQTAMDLVLLGTLPVVALALAADQLLGLPVLLRRGSA